MLLSTTDSLFSVAVHGINFSIPGTGGAECATYLSGSQRFVETVVATVFSLLLGSFALSRVSLPDHIPTPERRDRTSRKVVLFLLTLVFGMELGFKLATRQLIWVLNPCHVVTLLQLFLLVAPPKNYTMGVFRVMLHCLNGGTLALIFPILNTRTLPFEKEVYVAQHVLMLVIPFYLIRIGGVYTAEPLTDMTYVLLSETILFLYHWIFLQPVALLTNVNLNNMLCPAVSDPFRGPYYRAMACTHQFALILIHGKIYTWLSLWTLGEPRPSYTPRLQGPAEPPEEGAPHPQGQAQHNNHTPVANGHVKQH